MDKLPVGQLPDLTQSNNDDEIMVITNSEYNQLKKEKISDLITDFTSTNENNALTKGTDGKMFVTDFGNASNITEGTLPTSVLPEIPLEKIPDIPKDKLPPIETSDLPVSGVTADTYAYPSSVTVNAQGQVTAIEEGSPSGANANTDLSNLTDEGEKHFLNKTQLTNRILEAPNGTAEYSNVGLTGTAVVEDGILSGISSSSSAIIQSFQPGSSTWEAFFKVTTGSDTSVWSRIAMLNRTPNKYGGIHFGFQGGKFAWWMSTNGTSFNLANGQSGTHSIQSNTTYWVKVNWDGTKYTLAYSLTGDADSFVTDITKTSSTPLAFHPDSPEYAQIGTGAGAGAAGSMASIDLNSSYIKVNDEIWWEFNGTNPNQVILKEGLKLLAAVGRNSDGTLNSTEYTLSEDIPCTVSSSDVGYKYIALDTSSSDVTVYENYFSQEETPEVSNAVWFKPSENRFYVSDAEGEFSQAHIALFQVFKDKYRFFKGLYPDTAVNLATMDNVDGDWEVNQVVNLANGSSIPVNINAGGTVYTYDVSNYFPDDGCEYEIALSIEINNSAFVICYFWYPQTNNAIVFARGGNPTGGAMTAIVGLDRQIKISVASTQAARMWLYTDARKRLARKGA